VIEAFLAVLIIFSSFTVSSNLTLTQNETRQDDLASVGLQALMALDSDGSLGNYISEQNWTALREALASILPPSVCFNLTVYDEQFTQVNTLPVSNGGFNSQETSFIEYICVGQDTAFRWFIIHLHLAVAT
jgi:hypothetical protein